MKSAIALALVLMAGCAASPSGADAAGPHKTYPDKAFKLMCGGEMIEVHFTDMEAHLSNPDGVISAVKRLPGDAAVYSNGRVTLSRDGDKVGFARGKMAPITCAPMGGAEEHHH